MKRFWITGIISSLAAMLTGCETTSDIAAVQNFEPERYMGTWYEIARLPQYFERDLDEVKAQYTLNDDGTIKVVNSGVKDGEPTSITGKAKLKHPDAKPQTGELRVSFFWPFYSDYRVIELAPDQIDEKKGETVPDGPYETEQGILIGNNACFLFVQMWRDEELSRFWEEVDRMDIDELMKPE